MDSRPALAKIGVETPEEPAKKKRPSRRGFRGRRALAEEEERLEGTVVRVLERKYPSIVGRYYEHPRLLRVLEQHVVEPLGGVRSVAVDIRVIAATNQELPDLIKAGRFRLDLYYRLNVYQLRMPPLRERPEDIEPILTQFLGQARRERGSRIKGMTAEALAILKQYPWPGNVRELHNVVEWLTITCKQDEITPEHLPASFKTAPPPNEEKPAGTPSLLALGLSVEEVEKTMLQEALRKTGGNVSEASRLLKITRNTLRYRMAKHNLSLPPG